MEFKPPQQIPTRPNTFSIFLAGTIDNGNSKDWQAISAKKILDKFNFKLRYTQIHFYNPRRNNWDGNLPNEIENPQFYQQVNWELDAMNKADVIIMNFLPNSQSPITLLELGLYASSGKLIVCCPRDFWRSGNVQIICNNFNIPLYQTFDDLLKDFTITEK